MTQMGPYSEIRTDHAAAVQAMEEHAGLMRLAPNWVPRAFCTPGGRLKLDPRDLYPFAKGRGGIDERWLASTIHADNGPETAEFEGLSMVVTKSGGLVPLKQVVAEFKEQAIGALWPRFERWPMYAKFFDNASPLPFHLHHRQADAELVGKDSKPEAYYFPPQMNSHFGETEVSFFGLHPEVTRTQVMDRLEQFTRGGDNRITELSRGFRVALGTGWDVPAGVLHAPASVCTYEPQAASDVLVMAESWSNHREVPSELLWKDVPLSRHGDLDFIVDLMDWEANTSPEFFSQRFTPPVETQYSEGSGPGFTEQWITYRSPHFSAKELIVRPGAEIRIPEADAYGLIAIAGVGTLNGLPLESLSTIRFGQLTCDEYFVTAHAAEAGVMVTNASQSEDLVILKHFGPGNAELAMRLGSTA